MKDIIYQNYHKHSFYTNVIFIDSCTYPEEYAKRAEELGHTLLSSCEHGYGGRAIEYYELANKYNLKFLYSAEVYFVYDREEKDNTNAHLWIGAKNEEGRKELNRIITSANLTGYYYRARIDYDLLMSLNPDNVWVTSACLGGIWKYNKGNTKSEKLLANWSETLYEEPYEMLINNMKQHFKNNFFLEIQAHNTKEQSDLNKIILNMSNKYNIEMIAGTDSHYISDQDAWKRDYMQKSAGIFLEDEDGWFMDYPNGITLFNRFKRQGVLSEEQILRALENTNVFLDVEEYTSSIFNKEMKMPSAPKYANMTTEEKQKALVDIVKERWEEEKKNIPEEQHPYYLKEIAKELDIIFKINHADYFLLNYEIIKDAVENRGGMITFSGRGCLTGDAIICGIYDDQEGHKYLKDVKNGDKVRSHDGKFHTVLNTMRYQINEDGIIIYARDAFTTMTSDHKVLTLDKGKEKWVQAKYLTENNVVLYYSEDGIRYEYKINKVEKTYIKGFVYDLTVEGCHSYVANGYIVHNSGPSFYVNHLLGFTQIDRISSPITLYPERFLSTSRMTAGSLADIDFNCGNTPVFEETQTDIMGEGHAYPMIAYGTQKPKAAWKMYCRAVDVPFEMANAVSSKIDEYETDLKYWSEDSGEEAPDINDYLPEELKEAFEKSKDFLGLIDHASRHPCGNLLFSGDIREEFSLIRLKSKGGKETIVANCDGKWIESYLMLKNDLLTVACVKLNYLLYQRTGIPYMSLNKLLNECKEHSEVWDIYEHGWVVGLNQVEKNSTKRKVMTYKPKNISELSALIAGIRPAFKSLIDKLVNREHFEYGIPTLDKLLQTEELPESFILYQEQIMKILAFAGVPMGDCYTVIKSISKKRFEKIMHYKEKFINGMAKKLIEEEHISEEKAQEVTDRIWGIIEDASAYGFNSSHSLSVSFDSLLAAYFKALYTIEFYEVYLNLQMERADKVKALNATREMKQAFDIDLLPMRFGQDNRKYTAYKDKNALSNCLKSIKGFGDIVGSELFRLARHKDEFETFVDLLVAKDDYVKLYPMEVWEDYEKEHEVDPELSTQVKDVIKNTDFTQYKTIEAAFKESPEEVYEEFLKSKDLWKIKVNETQIKTLIQLDYFVEYGKNATLLRVLSLFTACYGKSQVKKDEADKFDRELLMECVGKETKSLYKDIDFKKYITTLSSRFENKSIPLTDQMRFEKELLEIPIYQNEELPESMNYVLGFKTYGDKINTPYVVLYNLKTGNLTKCQVNKSKIFRANPFAIGSILDVKRIEDIPRKKEVDGKWVTTDKMKTVMTEYEVLVRDEIAEREALERDAG